MTVPGIVGKTEVRVEVNIRPQNNVWSGSGADGTGSLGLRAGNPSTDDAGNGRVSSDGSLALSASTTAKRQALSLYGLSPRFVVVGASGLASLDVTRPGGGVVAFDPAFNPDVANYITSVENAVGEVDIAAIMLSADSTTTVTGSGTSSAGVFTRSLAVGINDFVIKVTPPGGAARVTNLRIFRRDAIPALPDPFPVATNSSLIPMDADNNPIFGVGEAFRLMFVTTRIPAQMSSIGSYNTRVRENAGTGTDLAFAKDHFRALISTPSRDARDNTATNRVTANDPDAPIYWVRGEKIADNYADFYDGTWDSVEYRNQDGGVPPSLAALEVWTGSNADGTGALNHQSSHGQVTIGHSDVNEAISFRTRSPYVGTNRPLYALSPRFVVAGTGHLIGLDVTLSDDTMVELSPPFPNAATTYHASIDNAETSVTVTLDPASSGASVTGNSPQTFSSLNVGINTFTFEITIAGSTVNTYTLNILRRAPLPAAPVAQRMTQNQPLVPSGLNVGDQFRLLYVSTGSHSAAAAGSGSVGYYNNIVQTDFNSGAAGGHADIRAFSNQFRALVSSTTVDARDNTATTGTGVPIYWLNGDQSGGRLRRFL